MKETNCILPHLVGDGVCQACLSLGDGIRQLGIRGRGALPLPEDTEEVEDPLTDMLSKSATDPGPDPGGGGGDGSGGLHAAITGAAARSHPGPL